MCVNDTHFLTKNAFLELSVALFPCSFSQTFLVLISNSRLSFDCLANESLFVCSLVGLSSFVLLFVLLVSFLSSYGWF